MDIATWKERFAKSGGTHTAEMVESRVANLSLAQRAAVWAWHRPQLNNAFEQTVAGPLQGVPFAAKDLFPVAGVPTRAGGKLFARPSRHTSRLITKLESLGAILTGKTHLHEFAYGLTGKNPHYGDVQHPHHIGRTAGGSSSGSAAAVAAGSVPFALGTDTAGSIRVPAAYSGLFGWRGSPRDHYISDAFPLAPSFDTAGWLTGTAADCARLWELVYGTDAPATESPRGAYLSAAALGITGNAEHTAALDAAAALLTPDLLNPQERLAQTVRGVDVTYSVLQSSEAYAVHQATLDRRHNDYGEAVWQRIDRGRHWTAAQMDDARRHGMQIKAAFDAYFSAYDFLVTPISIEPAPTTNDNSPETRDTLLKLNTHVSIAGRPAIALPVYLPGGLSLGLQIVLPQVHSAVIPALFKRCETCFAASHDSR
jgi:aspartyl-tRNA(Asn)/glutamyl-tRNA(Gln) amidotransferase subunit A